MYVSTLDLINFRNYSKLNINLNKSLNVFIGENAQGKTNILESIYFISTTKSHRTIKDKELIKWGSEKAYIGANVNRNSGKYLIESLIGNDNKVNFKLNGIKTNKYSDILGTLNTVIFSPEDLRLIKDGPAVRRRFIDGELNQIKPKYQYNLAQYNRALIQRNNILKSLKGSNSNRITAEIFGEQLAKYGSEICEERYNFIKKLSLVSRLIHRKITDGNEEIELMYECSTGDFKDKEYTKNQLLSYYTNSIDEDIKKGFTAKGPHRDDLIIKINGIDARAYGSQGQQRTAALSLKLSELEIIKSETLEYPVLLLDDVLSELDIKRQKFLLESLKDIQTFITCTSFSELNNLNFESKDIFLVHNGKVEKQTPPKY